jgi:hypothetical protein
MTFRWMGLGALGLCLLGFAAACSAASDSRFSKGTAASSGTGGSSSTGTLDVGATTSTGDVGGFSPSGASGTSTGSGSSECSDASKLVYVVGSGNELYSFSPPTLAIKQVGEINCVAQGGFGTPFSMAVARDGTAYVLFDDGKLFAIDTTTAECKATSFVPNQLPGFDLFGMGFSTNPGDPNSETLYVASFDGAGLGTIDLTTMKLSMIAPYDLVSDPGELTGTGDGRLFGFFLSTPVKVAEIDKTSAKILSIAPQPTVDIGGGWAFAFWGGDFWLFTAPSQFTSQIDRYQPSTKTTTKVAEVPFKIVGAGVSTCAPVEEPK